MTKETNGWLTIPPSRVTGHLEEGGFRFDCDNGESLLHCKPYLVWRQAGETAWRGEYGLPDATGANWKFSDGLSVNVQFNQLQPDAWTISGQLRNAGAGSVEVARVHYLDGTLPEALGLAPVQGPGLGTELFRRGQDLPAPRAQFEAFWRKWLVDWPRLPELIHDEPNWAVSVDAAVLLDDWNGPGWVLGVTGPGTAFGEVGLHTKSAVPRFYLGVLLEGIELAPGATRVLENAVVFHGVWQNGLRLWARLAAEQCHAPARHRPVAGYCSWYQHYVNIESAHVERATNDFCPWPVPEGGRMIQIDDGWQQDQGDWQPNARFQESFATLPARIAATGSFPSLWIAPTFVASTSSLFEEHPEWVQRKPDGAPAVVFYDWKNQQYAFTDQGLHKYQLDIDQPAVMDFIMAELRRLRQQGWRGFKIDFTYSLSTARRRVRRDRTSFESLRALWANMREAAGPDTHMNACIMVPGRYAIGAADSARLGFDLGADWDRMPATLRVLMMRFCTNGLWWLGDPDVFFMRQENSKLTEEECYLVTGTMSLLGGMLYTSDFPSQWSPRAVARLQQFWNDRLPAIPEDACIHFANDGTPLAYRSSVRREKEWEHRVGLYNWTKQSCDLAIPLGVLGLDPGGSWEVNVAADPPAEVGREGAQLVSRGQPPHSLRIVRLRHG